MNLFHDFFFYLQLFIFPFFNFKVEWDIKLPKFQLKKWSVPKLLTGNVYKKHKATLVCCEYFCSLRSHVVVLSVWLQSRGSFEDKCLSVEPHTEQQWPSSGNTLAIQMNLYISKPCTHMHTALAHLPLSRSGPSWGPIAGTILPLSSPVFLSDNSHSQCSCLIWFHYRVPFASSPRFPGCTFISACGQSLIDSKHNGGRSNV